MTTFFTPASFARMGVYRSCLAIRSEMKCRLILLSWMPSGSISRRLQTNSTRAVLKTTHVPPPADSGSYTRETYYGDTAFSDYPVIWVTQDQAVEYCSWVGRLPSETEWEYAARGPESSIFPWGDIFEPSRANYCDASCALGVIDPSYQDGYPETAPVGSFPAGASWCGALDMAGNVREWMADWYGGYSLEAQVNPLGPDEGDSHIPKGGCWLDRPDNLRAANRGANTPDYVRYKAGFRCVMDLD